MGAFINIERQLSAFIISVLEVIWGGMALFEVRSRIPMIMDLYGVKEWFSGLLILSGLLIIIGIVFPCRLVRHWGLILCPMVTVPAAGFAITNNIITAGALVLPFIGAMAILIFWIDVKGKPREKLPG